MNNRKYLFKPVSKQFGLLPSSQGLKILRDAMNKALQTPGSSSSLEQAQREAEVITVDVIMSSVGNNDKGPPNKYCKTMRRKVKELFDRHSSMFKAMVSEINLDEKNAFSIFVHVADKIFDDGRINWRRIVIVYTFAVWLAKQYYKKNSTYPAHIAHYAGKYVTHKLGQWIFDHGGWDAFVEYCPDRGWMDKDVLKGLLLIGMVLVVLALIAALW